jgi:twitching motility protein PilJ
MASSTDYAQEYQQAEKAYMQGNYQQAAAIIDRLVEASPNDPSARLLRGHIYCYGLQQYQVAQEQYESVLTLTSEQDFLDYASNGLEYARQCAAADDGDAGATAEEDHQNYYDADAAAQL